MILENTRIQDLVDTIEYLLTRMAYAEDRIEAYHHLQPPGIARFNEQIGRLRAILDNHIAPRHEATSADSAGPTPGGHR